MIDWVLRTIDMLQDNGKLPKTEVILPVETPKCKGKTNDFYREIHSDMRALRDTELKMTALFYQTAAFVFAGNMALVASGNTNLNEWLKTIVLAVSICFLVAFWLRVHARIEHDHKSYEFLMAYKRILEKEWFGKTAPIKPDHLGVNEAGPGYRKTQSLVALSSIAVVIVLVTIFLSHFGRIWKWW